MSEPAHESVSVVLPVHNVAATLATVVGGWRGYLDKSRREFEILLVDDGSADATVAKAEEIAAKHGTIRVLKHDKPLGYGASLRTGLAAARHPLVFFTAADYPYTPSDLGKLLDRAGQTDAVLGRKIDVVTGCRTGHATPAFWTWVGRLYRGFCRVGLGLPLEPSPTWLGFREHQRSWFAWLVFADPLHDPHAAFKLFRKNVFDKFSIQCDGDLVHIELIAKATFTECLIDEMPLTPSSAAIPHASWAGFGKLFFGPEFLPPAAPEPTA